MVVATTTRGGVRREAKLGGTVGVRQSAREEGGRSVPGSFLRAGGTRGERSGGVSPGGRKAGGTVRGASICAEEGGRSVPSAFLRAGGRRGERSGGVSPRGREPGGTVHRVLALRRDASPSLRRPDWQSRHGCRRGALWGVPWRRPDGEGGRPREPVAPASRWTLTPGRRAERRCRRAPRTSDRPASAGRSRGRGRRRSTRR